jgi:molecular chaperone HtpG
MSQMGGGMNFYGEMPDSYNIVLNSNHNLILKVADDLKEKEGARLSENDKERKRLKEEVDFMEKEHGRKKPEEISQPEKDDLEKLRKELSGVEESRKKILEEYGASNKVVKQLIDLALLANNMLRGEELSTFVRRSVELL